MRNEIVPGFVRTSARFGFCLFACCLRRALQLTVLMANVEVVKHEFGRFCEKISGLLFIDFPIVLMLDLLAIRSLILYTNG